MTIIHECLSKGKNLVLMRHVLIVELEVTQYTVPLLNNDILMIMIND